MTEHLTGYKDFHVMISFYFYDPVQSRSRTGVIYSYLPIKEWRFTEPR